MGNELQFMFTWFTYILRCRDGSLYTGISTNVAARLKTHNAGRGAAYTRSHGPVELVWQEVAASESAARKREAEIKRYSKKQKELFIQVQRYCSMELSILQKQIPKIFSLYLGRHGIKMDDDYVMLKIGEELGELIQAYLIHKKRCRKVKVVSPAESKKELAKELSDVFCLALVIAEQLDIDLEEAVTKKWITREWIGEAPTPAKVLEVSAPRTSKKRTQDRS
ncbi:GIY-YIG nuclease family protein [Patescibacteria group bacterium]|nr:GIY-YIG nuclease family protein [Patescibacteria group bacterium]